MPVDLIIYFAIAVVLVLWLRNTLGTRHGEERERPNPLEAPQNTAGNQSAGRVVDITDDVQWGDDKKALALPNDMFEGEGVADEMRELMIVMPRFDLHQFLDGARDAFPLIVESFAKADVRTLKELLSPDVYTSFERAIDDRAARGETIATEVHAVKSVKVLEVRKLDRMAFIKLRILADETCVIRDREGTIISGHPDKMTTMNDVWTFGRDVRSKDPTWYLYQTDDDVIEEMKNPLPDAGKAF